MTKKTRKTTHDLSNEEIVQVINRVANKLAGKFRFGYHDIDDMRQQARMIAWKGMAGWDRIRPLETYLWSCVHNGLFNFKRDNFARHDKPCFNCPFDSYLEETDECAKYCDFLECKHYSGWLHRNSSKRNLMEPIGISEVKDDTEDNMKDYSIPDEILQKAEIMTILDKEMPMNLYHDYTRMKHGVNISKVRRTKVVNMASDILREHGYEI